MFRIRFARRALLGVAALLALAVATPAVAGAQTRAFGSTTLELNPSNAAAFTSLGVTPGVIAPATAQ